MALSDSLAQMMGTLGRLVAGPEAYDIRRRAEQQTSRAQMALLSAVESANRAALSQRHLHHDVLRARHHEADELARQQPVIQREEQSLQRAEAALATARARGLPPPRIQQFEQRVAYRERRVRAARRPVERATRRRETAERSHYRATHDVHRRHRDLLEAQKHLQQAREDERELHQPKARPGRGLHYAALRVGDMSGQLVQGAAERGYSGLAGRGALVGAQALAEGAAVAFGGPYGKALSSAVDMLTKFAGAGFRAVEALDQYYVQAQQGRLALGEFSPSMGIVKQRKQFYNMVEDFIRGEELAGTEEILVEAQRDRRQAGRAMSNKAKRYEQRQDLIRTMEDERFDRNLERMHERFEKFGRSMGMSFGFLTEEMTRHEQSDIGNAMYQIGRLTNRLPWWAVPITGPLSPLAAGMKWLFGVEETEKDKERLKRFDEQAKKDKAREDRIKDEGTDALDPFLRGNIWENLRGEGGERSWAEMLIRAGRGEPWSEQMGLPDRFRWK